MPGHIWRQRIIRGSSPAAISTIAVRAVAACRAISARCPANAAGSPNISPSTSTLGWLDERYCAPRPTMRSSSTTNAASVAASVIWLPTATARTRAVVVVSGSAMAIQLGRVGRCGGHATPIACGCCLADADARKRQQQVDDLNHPVGRGGQQALLYQAKDGDNQPDDKGADN